MPNVILTAEFINQHRTERGAWTRAQIEAIGVKWPPRSGWIADVIGDAISGAQADAFIAGAGTFSERTLKKQRKQIANPGKSVASNQRATACLKACEGISTEFLEWPGANAVLREAFEICTTRNDC